MNPAEVETSGFQSESRFFVLLWQVFEWQHAKSRSKYRGLAGRFMLSTVGKPGEKALLLSGSCH